MSLPPSHLLSFHLEGGGLPKQQPNRGCLVGPSSPQHKKLRVKALLYNSHCVVLEVLAVLWWREQCSADASLVAEIVAAGICAAWLISWCVQD